MRLLPTKAIKGLDADDWIVVIRYRDQKGLEHTSRIGVGPLSETDKAKHETTEALAIQQAVRSIRWGRYAHFLGFMASIPLSERPDSIIDITINRRGRLVDPEADRRAAEALRIQQAIFAKVKRQEQAA